MRYSSDVIIVWVNQEGFYVYFFISRPSLSGKTFDDDGEMVSIFFLFSTPSLLFHNQKLITKHLCLVMETETNCVTYSVHSSSSTKTSKEEAAVLTMGF